MLCWQRYEEETEIKKQKFLFCAASVTQPFSRATMCGGRCTKIKTFLFLNFCLFLIAFIVPFVCVVCIIYIFFCRCPRLVSIFKENGEIHSH